MADSKLVSTYIPAYTGNYTRNRPKKISEITIHHCAGNTTIRELGNLWQRVGRNGSSHYGVHETMVGQFVLEKDVAWTNSNWDSNCRAVTIEVANCTGAPDWRISDASFDTLVKLVADIAERNNLFPLVLGKNVTWHSMYKATQCPGPYLFSRLQKVVDLANDMHKNGGKPIQTTTNNTASIITVGPASSGDVRAMQLLASSLLIGFINRNGTMEIGPATGGDQKAIIRKAQELCLPYKLGKVQPEKNTKPETKPVQKTEQYTVLVEGFTSQTAANTFAEEAKKKNLKTTIKKVQ